MRYSVGSGLGPRCNSRYIRTCCGMAAATPWRTPATTHGRYKLGSATKTSNTRFAIPNFRLPASATSGGKMAVKRVRAAVTGLQDERNRLGWPPIAPALEKRIREALATRGRPGIRVIAKQFGVNPGTVQRISRPFEQDAVAL